jgi:bacterial DNA-binding protein
MAKKEVKETKEVKEVKAKKEVEKELTEYELLVDKIAVKLTDDGEKISKSAIKKVLGALPDATGEVLTERGEIKLKGLLSAKLILRSARQGYDMIKKETIEIPEKVGVSMSASKALRNIAKEVSVKDFNKKFNK